MEYTIGEWNENTLKEDKLISCKTISLEDKLIMHNACTVVLSVAQPTLLLCPPKIKRNQLLCYRTSEAYFLFILGKTKGLFCEALL